MNILLKSISIENFKGIKHFNACFGESPLISGKNGAGKTSIFDAFYWLLFGKDSAGRAGFGWKPVDENGREIHFLDTAVAAELSVDGRNINISRTAREKWTKPRGKKEQLFGGNETIYEFDGVPCREADYRAKIAGLLDEEVFKLVTKPNAFACLKWQKQREILLKIVGEPDDEAVFVEAPELLELRPLLEGKSLDELRAQQAAIRKKADAELKLIPARIDELERGLPEEETYLETKLLRAEADVSRLQSEINILKNTSIAEIISAKKQRLEFIVDISRNDYENQRALHRRAFGTKNQELLSLGQSLEKNTGLIQKLKGELQAEQELRSSLVEEWKKEKAKVFALNEASLICPVCKRPFEGEGLEEMRKAALEHFNTEKALRLEQISKKGSAAKFACEDLEEAIIKCKEQAKTYAAEKEELLKELLELKTIGSVFEESEKEARIEAELIKNKEYISLKLELEELLKQDENTDKEGLSQLEKQLSKAKAGLNELTLARLAQEQAAQTKKRIAELEERETELAQAIADAEKIIEACEDFVRTKAAMLQSGINERFSYVGFKLFNEQQNGGIADTCEMTVGGVPHSDASYSESVKAGLDIINALCGVYGVYAPIFIDNRESINELIPCRSQIINLRVSNDKELVVA